LHGNDNEFCSNNESMALLNTVFNEGSVIKELNGLVIRMFRNLL
jgi:hypothetical protein